jgi:proton glutamate symport protein
MKRLQLHWQILIGLVLGILYGMYLSEHIDYVAWMGDVFLRGLKMVIVPLILSSIITGVANIGSAQKPGQTWFKNHRLLPDHKYSLPLSPDCFS